MWSLILFIIYFFCCRYYQATTFNTFGRPTTPNIPMTYQGSQVRPECFNVLDESYYNFSWIINFTIFFVKMWLFHEKLLFPIIYHIVYRNFAWHVFFNGCFCQKIIIICNNNILVSRKKNYFDFLICFFQLHLSTPSQEFNREEAESQRRIMDGSPPTPRSLRLDPRSAGHLSASQEELRR